MYLIVQSCLSFHALIFCNLNIYLLWNKTYKICYKHSLSFLKLKELLNRSTIILIAIDFILFLFLFFQRTSSSMAKSSQLLLGDFRRYHVCSGKDILLCTDAELLGVIQILLCLPSNYHLLSVITEYLLVHQTL